MQEKEFYYPGFKRLSKIAEEALAIEKEDAESAGSIGFIQRAFTLCSIPHKEIKNLKADEDYLRQNGHWQLRLIGSRDYGLPFGQIPRLIESLVTTEVVKTQSKKIYLGDSLTDFMDRLGIVASGGKRGTIVRVVDQLQRMFHTTTYLEYKNNDNNKINLSLRMSDSMLLLLNPKSPSQSNLWGAEISLTQSYYHGIMDAPVPIDMRMVEAFKGSPMELDIYFWLTHRLFTLKKPTVIPYELLQMQFGSDYKRKRAFKEKFLKSLQNVKYAWHGLNVSDAKYGLKLDPSPLLITPKKKKR